MRGTMSARQELNAYITPARAASAARHAVARRGHLSSAPRSARRSFWCSSLNALAFSDGSITGARLVLFVVARARRRLRPRHSVLAPDAAVAPLGRPRRSSRSSSSGSTRSSTKRGDEPFLELLAADTLDVARTVRAGSAGAEHRAAGVAGRRRRLARACSSG